MLFSSSSMSTTKQSHASGPGRPKTKIEINLLDPKESLETFQKFCKVKSTKNNLKEIGSGLINMTTETFTRGTQMELEVESVCELISKFDIYEKCYLMDIINSQMENEDKVKNTFMLYSDLPYEQKCEMFALLGNSLNDVIYEKSNVKSKNGGDLTIEDLKNVNKRMYYEECEGRLKHFIDHLTHRKRSDKDNTNFKSNIYENILKARNMKYLSKMGVKEHMVTYLSSGKSVHASQAFSKQGGKGTRPILEAVLKNSESVCKFEAPENTTLFFSFDNIQTLLKSHRIGGAQQMKVLAIVVCSILCLMPDGDKPSDIQYKLENTPAYWYSQYIYEATKKVVIQELNTSTLKDCLKLDKEETDIFNDFFEKDLKIALDFVENDLDDNQQDSIDMISRVSVAKRKRLCTSGHINDNVKSNRKICDRQSCTSRLQNQTQDMNMKNGLEKQAKRDVLDKKQEKANLYLNVPNLKTGNIPKEKPVGAIPVNPNTKDRLVKVLDETLEAAGMTNTYSVKIVISENNVKKVFDKDGKGRKFIVVTSDGLPYKIIMDMIKNEHKCATCGKRIEYLAGLTDHMHETGHCEYFQTYGNILPNIGHFHYSLTMLRSLVKLQWDIDYRELVKSIHFETPKALFMQEKVTDFRKSLDTYRTARTAKLRELVTPYVKYSKENNLEISVKAFFLWKKFFVCSDTYESIFQIEKFYGTSFLLFHASLRANNFKLVKIAKKIFSPLFHINRHPNYAIMDIHTDYLENTLTKEAPELDEYMSLRRTSNFKSEPYASEPHDERHEEFNKRGLNMQRIKTADDFKQSFQLVDHYTEIKNSCFEDYDIQIHGGNNITIQDYEDNITKMRVTMRTNSYLSKPERKTQLYSLAENEELNPDLPKLIKIARKQRQENVLKVIRYKDFNAGYDTSGHFKVLKNEEDGKLGLNFETQLKILIASEEDLEIRESLRDYCEKSKLHPNFDEEKLVEDILVRNFSFL